MMDKIEHRGGVFAAAGVQRMAGEANARAAAAKIEAEDVNALGPELGRNTEHVAGLVRASEAVEEEGDGARGSGPGAEGSADIIFVEREAVTVGEQDLMNFGVELQAV